MSDKIMLSEPSKARMLAWIEALESDEYEQCQGHLESTDRDGNVRHCCLGVLTRLAMADGVEIETTQLPFIGGGGPKVTLFSAKQLSGLPPVEVHLWLGSLALHHNVPGELANVNIRARVIRMNDDGEDFHAIAAKLREWYGLPKEVDHA